MNRQYGAQRFKGGYNPHRVGSLEIGTIYYLQDGVGPMGRRDMLMITRRNPWILVSWHNREYCPAMKGHPPTTYMVGGHLATVRSLRTGEVKQVADWLLRWHEDADDAGYGTVKEYAAPQPTPRCMIPPPDWKPFVPATIKKRRRKAA
jgi:hypothetical protein